MNRWTENELNILKDMYSVHSPIDDICKMIPNHPKDSIIYPFENINTHDYYLTPSYYYIKNSNMTEFDINGNTSIHKDRINVYN